MQPITLEDTKALDAVINKVLTARSNAATVFGLGGLINTGDKALDQEIAEKLDEALTQSEAARDSLEAAYKFVLEAKRLVTEAQKARPQ